MKIDLDKFYSCVNEEMCKDTSAQESEKLRLEKLLHTFLAATGTFATIDFDSFSLEDIDKIHSNIEEMRDYSLMLNKIIENIEKMPRKKSASIF